MRYGLLIQRPDGSYVVWGPRKLETAFSGKWAPDRWYLVTWWGPLNREANEVVAGEAWTHLCEAIAPYGMVITVVPQLNATELWHEVDQARREKENDDDPEPG